MKKKLGKKQTKKLWNKLFGVTLCPHCNKDLAEYVKFIWNSHGIEEETWKNSPIGEETNISNDFDQSWLYCPNCKKPIEIYLIKPHTLVIKKG